MLPALARIARGAGELILEVYATAFTVRGKADASPVTLADELAERFIVAELRQLDPSIPVVAEEAASRGDVPTVGRRFWLVDPLDGTREFVARNGEFTVNIALVLDAAPVLGVVYVPVQDRLYAGEAGQGAWQVHAGVRSELRCRAVPAEGLALACSRSNDNAAKVDAWLAGRRVAARVAAGSSLKFGLLAAGLADVYPRFGRTMEWDTAAGHAVLRAAGGEVRDLHGRPLGYGKPGFENPDFIASGLP